jgi:hypothetical protein
VPGVQRRIAPEDIVDLHEAQEQIFETVMVFYDKHLNGMGTSVSRRDQ